ncbi:MAG: hypothetical protein KDI55_02270 [Anaerolineae bacterium]|nr:hypothetical protein [Anaerolineae bacterium]
MATLQPFFSEGVNPGDSGQLRVKEIIWITAGHGEVTALSDYVIGIESHVDVKFYKGDLNIYFNLLDEDASAKSGPARAQLNAHIDENAAYEVDGHKLVVRAVLGGEDQRITLSRDKKNMTKCEVAGSKNLTVFVVPN